MEDKVICERCQATLNPKKAVYLVFQTSTGTYHSADSDRDWFDTEDNQGCFPFGSACAKAQLKEDQPRW